MTDNMMANKPKPEELQRLQEVLQRAEKGDTSALPALRELLHQPKVMKACGGDLAQQIEVSLIRTAAGTNLALREALYRKTQQMRAELAGPNPSPLEQLLVERVVTCWLHLHITELGFVQSDDLSIREASYRHRALDHCQKRYLSAIKMLALVRKLALPVLQVNIAQNQVNVAESQSCATREGLGG